MRIPFIFMLAMVSLPASAQPRVPDGTVVPVTLDHGLDARKASTGQKVRAEVMQDIPGTPIRRGARLVGSVVAVSRSRPARLAIHFDAVEAHGSHIPIAVNLRAVASWLEVNEAERPQEALDRAITPEIATTRQIGGEWVYRGGGSVVNGQTTVGKPVPYGVLGVPRPAEDGCTGPLLEDSSPQAFWVFSTNACGVYGLEDVRIQHAGPGEPAGSIVLVSDTGNVKLRAGAGLLLRTAIR